MNSGRFATKIRKEVWLIVLLIIAGIAVVFFLRQESPRISRAEPAKEVEKAILPETVRPAKHFKILHIMSYHLPWKWTEEQLAGFKEALGDLDVEYKVIQMDAKRHSDEQWKLKVAAEAKELIGTWKPDLVFTGDDDAQQYVAKDYVNTNIPIVFCAVNAEPKEYGFAGSKNVTGVLERIHFTQAVQLLKQLVPTVHKIAIITDTGKMWVPVMENELKRSESELPQGIEVAGYYVLSTFEEYKKTVKDCEGKVDALGMLGVFEFKDENGNNVPLEQVQRWTVENSTLPDFSFWDDRVKKGTLCAVTVSGIAQGQAAGKMARGILSEGRNPAGYPMKATEKGIPIVNLARAKKLNINPASSVLLTAEVVTEFTW
jgi:ABC-type uncharacterized transport system substrate-binding protein